MYYFGSEVIMKVSLCFDRQGGLFPKRPKVRDYDRTTSRLRSVKGEETELLVVEGHKILGKGNTLS